MKQALTAFALIVFLGACQEKKFGAFTVSGKILHAASPTNKILLQEIPFGGDAAIVLDSTSLSSNGNFTLHAIGKEEGLYRLAVENGPDVLLVNDGNDIKLSLDVNSYKSYTVDGSPASAALHVLFEGYRLQDSTLYAIFTKLDTLQAHNASDSAIQLVRQQRDQQIKLMNKTVSDFINASPSPAARYYVIGMAARTMNQEEVLALTNASAAKFSEHSGLAKLKAILTAQKPSKPVETGSPLLNKQAPEISLPDTSGKIVTLSSFKGKYVLVDFWASWCGPCRRENPNVVAAFQKYKDKNFTILGVSLDKAKEDWLGAIKEDKLAWTHVSDLKYWDSGVVPLYGIDGIPFNVLVDPTGKIIGTALRGEDLEKKLAEVLK